MVERSWKVLPHDPIEELEENLWRVEGSVPRMALRRQMVVVRNGDGRLLIHNGVALDDASMAKLEAWGTPTWLVVPSGYHRIDARAFKDRYPDLLVVCPRGARKDVEQKVPVDLTYDELEPTDTLRLSHHPGMREAEGVLEVRSERGVTLVFNDTLFNTPHLPGLFGAVYKLFGQSGRPTVTAIAKMFVIKDKKAYAQRLHDLADTEGLVRVIPGHVTPIDDEPAATLHRVADELAS